jgi:uncharacterized RDD family membrane protein YckC
VFAAELALATLANSISAYWTAYELDQAGRSPRLLAFVLGALFCIPGLLWLMIESRWIERPPLGGGQPDPALAAEEEVLEGRIG